MIWPSFTGPGSAIHTARETFSLFTDCRLLFRLGMTLVGVWGNTSKKRRQVNDGKYDRNLSLPLLCRLGHELRDQCRHLTGKLSDYYFSPRWFISFRRKKSQKSHFVSIWTFWPLGAFCNNWLDLDCIYWNNNNQALLPLLHLVKQFSVVTGSVFTEFQPEIKIFRQLPIWELHHWEY